MFWPGFHKFHFVRGQERPAVCIFARWERVRKVFGKSWKSRQSVLSSTNRQTLLWNVISFHGIQHFFPLDRKWVNQIATMSFVSELQVSCPEEVTWDRKAAHNALDQRDVTSKRLWERRSVNPSAQREYYNLIMESDLDHNRIYGCSENGFGSDVCSEAAKRWPAMMPRKPNIHSQHICSACWQFSVLCKSYKRPLKYPEPWLRNSTLSIWKSSIT